MGKVLWEGGREASLCAVSRRVQAEATAVRSWVRVARRVSVLVALRWREGERRWVHWEKSEVEIGFSGWRVTTRLAGRHTEGWEGGEWARSIAPSACDPNILSGSVISIGRRGNFCSRWISKPYIDNLL